MNAVTPKPLCADNFEIKRQTFLSALLELPPRIREEEFRSTISAMSQLMALSEIG